MPLMRSWLFVPGNRPRMVEKAFTLDADVLIFDLEDSVPAGCRSSARALILQALARPRGRALRYVRINPSLGGGFNEDVVDFVSSGINGIALPKVETPTQIEHMDGVLSRREHDAGLEPRAIRILAIVESARGLLAAPAIAASSSRLTGLMFGAEDFQLGFPTFDFRGATCDEMIFARSAIAVAAASCGLSAVDRVVPDFRDAELLVRDARQAYSLGYAGKALIHPDQIAPVNEVFSPTARDIEEARRVIAAFDAAVGGQDGTVAVDGRMIDAPVYAKARRVMAIAKLLACKIP